jgi:hypothetical protein
MTKKFKEETYGAAVPQVIKLSRKQIEQMNEMISHFKDVNDFELHISNESGIGASMNFKFSLDLTDVEKW